jgi:NAD dependent epimerase/dehydratase
MAQPLKGKRILITGADGFIGSHLVEALVRGGAVVRALVLYNSFNSWGWLDDSAEDVKGKFEVVAGDIRDAAFVQSAVQGQEIVLHLAALISIPYSYQAPSSFVDTNITGTLNILQAARDTNATRVISTSTSEVYGTANYVPINEDHPLHAQSPYAATKIAADQMALAFHRTFGTPVLVLRPFNTFGPRQSARAVIPTIITQIASGIRDIKLGSLHPTRDFSFVADIVRGFICAATSQAAGEVINIGSGFEISIGDAAKLIAKLMKADITFVRSDERIRPDASEVERLFAGIDKAKKTIGWKPEYVGHDGFARGLQQTVDWFRDSSNLRRYKAHQYNV